jgi:hypothetical protein
VNNLWPTSFDEVNIVLPKNLLEEQASYLAKMTGGFVTAEVSLIDQINDTSPLKLRDFAYRFDLIGKMLQNYCFNLLIFTHDITIYPVFFYLEEGIGKELKTNPQGDLQIDDEANLERFIQQILRTDRVKRVIGSMIRLSR